MISLSFSTLYTFLLAIEKPILFKVKLAGGIANLYVKLDKKWFHDLNIDTVIDLGSNIGQFTNTISALLPNAKIFSFEPIPSCFTQLCSSVKKNSNVRTFNLGIGSESGVISFQQSKFSAASSFLIATDKLKESFPHIGESNNIDVTIARLDDVVRDLEIGNSLFIKIDVQGYEDKVLAGGEQTIRRSKVIIIETSFEKLYNQQPLFHDIYNILVNWGFTYIGNIDQTADPLNGKPLQCDAIFLRN
jgi:FkbM family methyltransferase